MIRFVRKLPFLTVISFFYLSAAVSLISLWSDTAGAESYWRRYDTLLRNYNLYGSIGLTYQKQWFENDETFSYFTQSYNLGLRGFVVDPRLVYFDVSGYFTKTNSSPGEDFSLLGQNMRVVLLQKLPQKWLSSWKYIPHPITLRFSHYANSAEYTNYGISLKYGKPYEWTLHEREVRQQQEAGANAENEANANAGASATAAAPKQKGTFLGLNFPVTYFDYDHYKSTSEGQTSSTNLYSVRSFMQGKVYDYRLYFEHQNVTGISPLKRTLVQFEPNYRFFDPDTKRLLDIYNALRYQNIEGQKTYEVHSRVNLYRPFGYDTLMGQGSLDYSRTSDKSSTTDVFNVTSTVSYNRVVSPRLSYMPFVAVGYGTSDTTNSHFERVGSNVSVDLSRVFRNTSTVFVGGSQEGLEYGAETFFMTKTRISASLGYAVSSIAQDNGRALTQRAVLNASGPIIGNLSFNTYADFTRRDDDSDPEDPFVEDALRGAANLYWYFYRTSVTVGGSYSQVKRRNTTTDKTDVTTLSAALTRVITRNTLFTLYSLWIRDSLKNKSLEITPRLQWSLRQTAIDVEYKYRRVSLLGAPSTTDHRLTVNFIRYFSANFRM